VTSVGELRIGGSIEGWQHIGLHLVDDVAIIDDVALRFVGGEPGLQSWALCESPEQVSDIDGIPTEHVARPVVGGRAHELPILGIDHVVVNTSSLERTCGAIEAATGEPLKRIRDLGSIRQGFHRLGVVIIEVVESPQVNSTVAGLWGFVWNVDDLHGVCDHLGPEVISLPKPAVQPGRFIATVRPGAGLGLPLALMSPRT
jgi:hypothetical protein